VEKSYPMGMPTALNVDKYGINFSGGSEQALRYVEKAICEFFTLLNPIAKRWRLCHSPHAGAVVEWESHG
jgi:hypothetical protein